MRQRIRQHTPFLIFNELFSSIHLYVSFPQKEEKLLKDYTNEMRQIFLNTLTVSKDKGDSLEQEMAFVFENPEKHTWREG